MQTLSRNAAQCLVCKTIIESRTRHDLVACSCGALMIDGGLAYSRITGAALRSGQWIALHQLIERPTPAKPEWAAYMTDAAWEQINTEVVPDPQAIAKQISARGVVSP